MDKKRDEHGVRPFAIVILKESSKKENYKTMKLHINNIMCD